MQFLSLLFRGLKVLLKASLLYLHHLILFIKISNSLKRGSEEDWERVKEACDHT